MTLTSLAREIAGRRCIPFLGAGVSRQARTGSGDQPPTWGGFLEKLLPNVDEEDRGVAKGLIDDGNYLDAAEVILYRKNAAAFGLVVDSILRDPDYAPSELHELIVGLDAKVIITTNYDNLFEDAARSAGLKDLRVCRYYEDHAVDVLRSDKPLLIKAHGCVENPSKIVLSRSDYHEIRRQYPYSLDLINSLFFIHTVLFIGYRLTDPDIQLVLENSSIAAQSEHPHYAVMPTGTPDAIVLSMRRAYNVQIIQYDPIDDDHSGLVEWMRQLSKEVSAIRGS